MKKILTLAIISILFSCGESQSPEKIQEAIDKHQEEIKALQNKLAVINEDAENNDNQKADNLRVTTETINFEHFEHRFTATGSVEAVQSAFISPEMNGQIKTIHVEEGQTVYQGQLLVSLSNKVLKANLANLQTNLELATTMFEKQKQLWEQNIGTEVQYLQAKNGKESLENQIASLKAQIEMTEINAPFAGIVDQINAKEGELASPGFQIIQLVNLSKIEVNADVSENYISKVKKGQSAKITFPSFDNLVIEDKISRTGNMIKTANRTFTVEVTLNNPQNMLKPNTMAVLEMIDFTTDSAKLVPSLVIKQDIHGNYVYVIDNANGAKTAAKRYVNLGLSFGDKTMIESGIEIGEEVITGGFNLVRDGQAVSVASTN